MKRSILIFLLLPSIGYAASAPKPKQVCRVDWKEKHTGDTGHGNWMSHDDAEARAAWYHSMDRHAYVMHYEVECQNVPKPWYKKMLHK